jgi:hypothetical protein
MTNQIVRTYQIANATGNSLSTLLANAGNSVLVGANSGSLAIGNSLNFINTSTVSVVVTANADGNGNANIAFSSSGGSGGGSLGNVSVNSGSLLTAQTGINFINSISAQINVSPGIGSNANVSVNTIVKLIMPCSDLVTPINQAQGYPGTLAYVRSPRAFTITGARASLYAAGSSGNTQIQITYNGTNVFTTLLQIDNLSSTSVGSNVTPVLGNTAVPDNAVLDFNTTNASNGTGLIVTLYGI